MAGIIAGLTGQDQVKAMLQIEKLHDSFVASGCDADSVELKALNTIRAVTVHQCNKSKRRLPALHKSGTSDQDDTMSMGSLGSSLPLSTREEAFADGSQQNMRLAHGVATAASAQSASGTEGDIDPDGLSQRSQSEHSTVTTATSHLTSLTFSGLESDTAGDHPWSQKSNCSTANPSPNPLKTPDESALLVEKKDWSCLCEPVPDFANWRLADEWLEWMNFRNSYRRNCVQPWYATHLDEFTAINSGDTGRKKRLSKHVSERCNQWLEDIKGVIDGVVTTPALELVQEKIPEFFALLRNAIALSEESWTMDQIDILGKLLVTKRLVERRETLLMSEQYTSKDVRSLDQQIEKAFIDIMGDAQEAISGIDIASEKVKARLGEIRMMAEEPSASTKDDEDTDSTRVSDLGAIPSAHELKMMKQKMEDEPESAIEFYEDHGKSHRHQREALEEEIFTDCQEIEQLEKRLAHLKAKVKANEEAVVILHKRETDDSSRVELIKAVLTKNKKVVRDVTEMTQKVEELPKILVNLQKEATDMASMALIDTDTHISEMQEKILFHTLSMYMEFCVYLQLRANDFVERKQVVLDDLAQITDQANKRRRLGLVVEELERKRAAIIEQVEQDASESNREASLLTQCDQTCEVLREKMSRVGLTPPAVVWRQLVADEQARRERKWEKRREEAHLIVRRATANDDFEDSANDVDNCVNRAGGDGRILDDEDGCATDDESDDSNSIVADGFMSDGDYEFVLNASHISALTAQQSPPTSDDDDD